MSDITLQKLLPEDISKYDWTLMRPNGIREYLYGLVDKNGNVLAATDVVDIGDNEIYIHLFEVRECYRGLGYGKKMFNEILSLMNPYKVKLEYSDYVARSFWKHMGFKPMEYAGWWNGLMGLKVRK